MPAPAIALPPRRRPAPLPFLTIIFVALVGFLTVTGGTHHAEPRLYVYDQFHSAAHVDQGYGGPR